MVIVRKFESTAAASKLPSQLEVQVVEVYKQNDSGPFDYAFEFSTPHAAIFLFVSRSASSIWRLTLKSGF